MQNYETIILELLNVSTHKDAYEKIEKMLMKQPQKSNIDQPYVVGSLPLYDVEYLNEIVARFNNKEMTLFEFVGRVWNKAYTLGCVDSSKGNAR